MTIICALERMWNNYKNPDITARQRELVDRQLRDMKEGNAPGVYAAIKPALDYISKRDGDIFMLDAGCASGYYKEVINFYAPDLVRKYAGVDYNFGMIRMARERYGPVNFFEYDLTDLFIFGPNTFDLVFSSAAIQHIEDWQQAIRELVRVTKRWLLLHRNRIWIDDRETKFIREPAYGVQLNCWIFNCNQLVQLLEDCGMSMELELPAGEGPTGEAIKREGWMALTYLWGKHA